MKKENIFYIIFVLTIFFIRTSVFLFPQRKIMIGGKAIHHFWIGVAVILLVSLFPKSYTKLRTALFPIGLGMVADELTFLILGGGTARNYWSIYSISGTIVILAIIFSLRKKLAAKI